MLHNEVYIVAYFATLWDSVHKLFGNRWHCNVDTLAELESDTCSVDQEEVFDQLGMRNGK